VGISISDALFTRTQQRVLGVIFGWPERSFLTTEVIARAAAGRGGVQRELARLTESGLITVTRVGNQRHYRANPHSPIFEELRGIVMKTSGLADPIRDALKPLARRVELAVLFGSIAKGTAHAASDVDLLLVADKLTLEQAFKYIAPAEREIGRKVNVTLYTRDEYRRRRTSRSPFLDKVLAGEHLVLMGSIDDTPATR
jgi:predicted nucleotidyltransferase